MGNIFIPQDYRQNIDRALHNLYQEKRTTLHPMTAIPLFHRRMFKGDKFTFGAVERLLQSHPTFAPLLANWRLRFEWYFDSDANRYGWIDNNTRLTAEEVMNRRHHTFSLNFAGMADFDYENSDIELGSVGRGSIMDYSGIPPQYCYISSSASDADEAVLEQSGKFGSTFNLDFFLTYLNIIRNYHVNRQFPDVPFVQDAGADSLGGPMSFSVFGAKAMDNLFMALRSCPNGIHLALSDNNGSLPYDDSYSTIPDWVLQNGDYANALSVFCLWLKSCAKPYGGLFCTQFEPDLYQNLLNQDQGLLKSIVNVVNGGFSVETFRLSNHLQILYDEIFVSGGRDRDLSRTRWGVSSNLKYDIPELICVHSDIIGTNLIQSNNAGQSVAPSGEQYDTVPGDLSGNVNVRRKGGNLQTFTAKTAGNLMCIVTLTPMVDYCQNIERHLLENRFEDEFSPQMARKGFEDVPLTDYYALPQYSLNADENYIPVQSQFDRSVGKQVAWLREMTATNRVHGEFSNGGEMSDWVLKRNFEEVTEFERRFLFSPYGNPLQFQYPFVSQSLLDPNFSLQVGFVCKAYRPVGRRYMPTLGV